MEPGPFGQLLKLLLGSRRGPDGRHEGAPQQPENREHDHWPNNERSPPLNKGKTFAIFSSFGNKPVGSDRFSM